MLYSLEIVADERNFTSTSPIFTVFSNIKIFLNDWQVLELLYFTVEHKPSYINWYKYPAL